MRKLRFLAFAVISFVAALFGALLSPSTWLHKSLAVALCGVLSANPALCTNNAIAVHSQEASATNPVKVETTQSHNLLADRANDFGVDTPKSSPNNNPKPPSFPNEVSPNTPVRSPDFDNAVDRAAKDSAADVQRRSDAIDRAAKDSAADVQRSNDAINRAAKDSAADVQRRSDAIDRAANNAAALFDKCGRPKCDFDTKGRSMKDQRCFGASGAQCESGPGKQDPNHPPRYNYDNCSVEMFISEGSRKHDKCCIDHPNGFK